jgi:hypothetical protein
MRAYRVAVSGAHLGELGSPATIRKHLQAVRASNVVQTAAKLSIYLEGVAGEPYGSVQLDLVNELFSGHIADRLKRGLATGGDGGGFDVMFFPGQLMSLQKLAVAVGQPGPPTSFDQRALFGHFLTLAAQVNDVRDSLTPVASEEMNEYDLAIYGFRTSELNQIRKPPSVAGRAHRLWVDSPVTWPSELEDPNSFCDREFGTSFARFAAIAAAPALARMSVDSTRPDDIPVHPRDYFEKTRIDTDEAAAVLGRLTYHTTAGPEAVEAEVFYWSLVDLANRPMVPCGTGLLVPTSLRYGLERATTGVFWMLHAAHAGDVGRLTTHFDIRQDVRDVLPQSHRRTGDTELDRFRRTGIWVA